VLSRIDYANSLFVGLPSELLDRLQRVLNRAARVTCLVKKFSSITPHLKSLRWLPVRQRIQLKLAILTFHCTRGSAPSYLSSLIDKSSRSRRDVHAYDLIVPRTRLVHYGDRSFSKAAPSLWNSLPLPAKKAESLGIFKSIVHDFLSDAAFAS
jgi:hypothetical protein